MTVAEYVSKWSIADDTEQIAVQNPVTQELLGHVPVRSAEEVRQAAVRARNAQPDWQELGVKARARLLRKWGDLLWADQKNVIHTIRSETGKTELGAWEEVVVIDNTVGYYTHNAERMLRPQTRKPTIPIRHKARVYYKPHGVAGFITPWNYPLLNAWQDAIPALIAGNTILLKPSEITPYTSLLVAKLMHKAGIPEDVVQIITGAGSTGSALVDVVDYIAFTGSTATGRKIAMRAAERLIPCSLELGGKDPLIVLSDADLELAAAETIVAAASENSGQVCISTERVYVESGIYDRFIERVMYYADQVVIGPQDGYGVHVGSLTNERELMRVEAQIKDALSKGAEIIHGGKRRPDLGPLFFEPTILVNVDHSMDVMREETFGPIIPIMRVKDADEAIQLANDSEYGLSAAILTSDLRRGEQLATRIESGDVHINTTHWIFGTPSLPMGGVKNSGMGRRNGPEGMLRFIKHQSILIDNQLLQKPSVARVDAIMMKGALLLRELRRRIPLLRV
ncbi:MAG: succinic semialdehyde dehydrogenase [Anaerolineae bacterium]